MTSNHIFYIPLMILVGLILGFLFGRKSMMAEIEYEQRRKKRREARRDMRSGAEDTPSPGSPGEGS